MPDVPGSGPTDPDFVVRSIRLGVTWHDGHLRRDHGAHPGDRWLAVADVPGSGPTDPERAWMLVSTKGVLIDADTFDKLTRCDVIDGFVHVDGKRYKLVPPIPLDRRQFAVLKLA